MSPRWKKILRDLWAYKSRTLIVVLTVAVGVTAFGSVFITLENFIPYMLSEYKASNPASLTMYLPRGFEPDLLDWVARQKGVKAVRGSTKALIRVYTPQGAINIALIALNDYDNIKVNKVKSVSGTWPPKRNEIVFERSSLAIAPYNIGEIVEVETSGGKKKKLTLAGTVHDLRAIPATLYPELTAYVTFDTMRYLDSIDYLTYIEIQTDQSIVTIDDSLELGNRLKEGMQNRGVPIVLFGYYHGVTIQPDKPNTHWAEDTANGFNVILIIIGASMIFLSMFLVYNTVSAMIAQQKKQIGIMKAIGARQYQIMILFLSTAFGYGLLAILVALPLATWIGYLCLALATTFLNLDIVNFTIPFSVFLMIVVASLGIPLTAAIVPVIKGTSITVREAISDLTETKHHESLLDRIINRLSLFSRPITISVRNTFRRKARLVFTLVTMVIAGAVFISVMGVRESMTKSLDSLMGVYNYDLELFFDKEVSAEKAVRDALKNPQVAASEAVVVKVVDWQKEKEDTNEALRLFGVKYNTEFMKPGIISGRWLQKDDTNQIVLSNKYIRNNPGLKVGQFMNFKINQHIYKFEIVGIYLQPNQKFVLVNEKYLKTLDPDVNLVSSIRIKTYNHSSAFRLQFAKEFEQQMKHKGYSIAYSLTSETVRSTTERQNLFIIGFLLDMALLIGVAGGLGLAGTMSLNVLERTREIGVMRSIGASNGTIFRLVVGEGVCIGVISWLIAVPLAIPFGYGFCYALGIAFNGTPLPYVFSKLGVLIWLGVVIIIAIIASLAPAKNAVSVTVKDTLAYE